MRVLVPAVFVTLQAIAAPLQFEVASVKPSSSSEMNWSWDFNGGGGFSGTNMPLRSLMTIAFHIRDFQVSGLPRWAGAARYDVLAKAEGHPNSDQIMLMLQSLLASRFKLKYHNVSKQAAIYALIPAKTGVKLHDSKDANGSWSTYRNRLEAKGVTMAQFVAALTAELDRPVIDQTGFQGTFSAHLEFAPPELTAAGVGENVGPSIFTVLQEQLGLRLASQKGPVPMFVIDHIEKPDEN